VTYPPGGITTLVPFSIFVNRIIFWLYQSVLSARLRPRSASIHFSIHSTAHPRATRSTSPRKPNNSDPVCVCVCVFVKRYCAKSHPSTHVRPAETVPAALIIGGFDDSLLMSTPHRRIRAAAAAAAPRSSTRLRKGERGDLTDRLWTQLLRIIYVLQRNSATIPTTHTHPNTGIYVDTLVTRTRHDRIPERWNSALPPRVSSRTSASQNLGRFPSD